VPIKLARRRFLTLTISVMCALCPLTFAVSNSLAQSAASPNPQQDDVVLTKLSPPVFSNLGEMTAIQGDLELKLGIRQNGTVESAEIVSGPAMQTVRQAVLKSALHSQFDCSKCIEPVTLFRLVYTFKPDPPSGCEEPEVSSANATKYPQITHTENRVIVTGQSQLTCDPVVSFTRVRSAKCLWLWRCGHKPYMPKNWR
jgi:hypothetical protein